MGEAWGGGQRVLLREEEADAGLESNSRVREQLPVLPLKVMCPLLPLQALGCVLYACFILGRFCVPVFANMSREPFSTRALVLSVMHATLPGMPTKAGLEKAAPWGRLSRKLLLPLTLYLQSISTPFLSDSPFTSVPSYHCLL